VSPICWARCYDCAVFKGSWSLRRWYWSQKTTSSGRGFVTSRSIVSPEQVLRYRLTRTKRQGPFPALPFCSICFYAYFTASCNALPGVNLGIFFALISITTPVRGFLPFLAFLWPTLKVPNPTRETVSLFFNALVMDYTTQSTAAWASFLVLTTLATSLIKSPLFMLFPSLSVNGIALHLCQCHIY